MRVYKCREPTEMLDLATQRKYVVEDRRARYLTSLYPSRFKIIAKTTEKEKFKMPAMPTPPKKLPNGVVTLISASHKTTEGKYGLQEAVTVVVHEPTGFPPKTVWVSHGSYKQIKAALDCGLARMVDEGNWEINDGALFSAIVQNGRFVSLLPHEQPSETAEDRNVSAE